MPKKTNADIALKALLKNKRNFASVFNAYFFDGRQVVRPEDLYEVDSHKATELGLNYTIKKMADIAKLWITDDMMQLLVMENQTYIDYGMTVREIEEHAAFLGEQRGDIMQENRAQGRLSKKTWLSGMRREDKVIPVRVLTIYYGRDPWDAPIDTKDVYVRHMDMGPKYNEDGITLLEVRNEHLPGLTKDVRDLFNLLKTRYAYASSRDAFMKQLVHYLADHDVSLQTIKAFANIIESDGVLNVYQDVMKKKKGGVDMSVSVEHWVREWVEDVHPEWIQAVEDKQEEVNRLARKMAFLIIQTGRAAGASEEETIRKIMLEAETSEETARRFLDEYNEEDKD